MMSRLPALLLLSCAAAFAQPKPTIAPADYAKFETLGAGTLSADGKWLAYEIRRSSGDNELRVSSVPATGKPQVLAFCSGQAFSADSKWLACLAGVSETEQQRNTRAGRPNQNKLLILDLSAAKTTTIDAVQSLAFAGDGPYLAYRKYPPTAAPATGAGRGAAAAPAAAGRGGRGGRGSADEAERDPTGAALIVRNLSTDVETAFGNVTSYSWQDKGSILALAIGIDGRTGNAVQTFDPRSGTLKVLDSGPALFTALTWRKESNDLAALRSLKQDGYEGDSYQALAWKNLGEKRTFKVDAPSRITTGRAPQWSEDGAILYIGVAEWPKKIEVKQSDGTRTSSSTTPPAAPASPA